MRYPLLLKNLKFGLLRSDSPQRKEMIEAVIQDQIEKFKNLAVVKITS